MDRNRLLYGLLSLLVFVVEVVIAAFMHDAFVRPYLGDSLAVVLVYLGLRTISRLGVQSAVVAAFVIACLIEASQFFHVLRLLGLDHNRLARIVLGGAFDPKDFAAYAGGALIVLAAEGYLRRRIAC